MKTLFKIKAAFREYFRVAFRIGRHYSNGENSFECQICHKHYDKCELGEDDTLINWVPSEKYENVCRYCEMDLRGRAYSF